MAVGVMNAESKHAQYKQPEKCEVSLESVILKLKSFLKVQLDMKINT